MNEWISVKDRLPDNKQKCLICNSRDRQYFSAIYDPNYQDGNMSYTFDGGWVTNICMCCDLWLGKIDYWMPIPEFEVKDE